MPPAPTVLVLAVGGNVSQGILKALARCPEPHRVIGADISAAQMGLYTVDTACVAPWANQPAFIPWLIACCRREHVDLILSGCEPVLMELARHQEAVQAETGALCLVSAYDVMETCDDKWKTCQWLTRHGFRCPPSAPTSDPGAIDALVRQAGFPLLAKPRRGGGARGHFSVEDLHDLDYARRKNDYLLQAPIGTSDQEFTVGCFRDRDGNLAPSCVMRRQLHSGTTVRAELGDFPDVRHEAEQITAALRPTGPCNIQLRTTSDGPTCIEINPRFSGTTPIRAYYGYNEPGAAVAHFLHGKPVDLPRITRGMALRYWNELYIDPAAHDTLRKDQRLDHPSAHPHAIELYGAHPEEP